MMPTMPPDSHKISLKIIEAIKQHPVLYINDVKGTTIKVQEFRQKVWKRISDQLTLDPTWVRLRWKNLRDTYCRILKYKNKTDKGVRRKKWVFEDHLSFLKFPRLNWRDELREMNRMSNRYEADYQPQCAELTDEYIQEINNGGTDSQELLDQLEDREDEDYSEYLEVLEETTADPVLEDSEVLQVFSNGDAKYSSKISESDARTSQQREIDNYVQQIQSKYRKIRPKRMKIEKPVTLENSNSYSILKSSAFGTGFNTVDSPPVAPIIMTHSPVTPGSSAVKSENTTSSDSSKNSTELFFNSMARTVKQLPLRAQIEIKMAVCKIVTEAEMKYLKSHSSKNTQRFVTPPGMIPKLVLVPCSMIDKPANRDSTSKI